VDRPGMVHRITRGKNNYYYEVIWGRRQQSGK